MVSTQQAILLVFIFVSITVTMARSTKLRSTHLDSGDSPQKVMATYARTDDSLNNWWSFANLFPFDLFSSPKKTPAITTTTTPIPVLMTVKASSKIRTTRSTTDSQVRLRSVNVDSFLSRVTSATKVPTSEASTFYGRSATVNSMVFEAATTEQASGTKSGRVRTQPPLSDYSSTSPDEASVETSTDTARTTTVKLPSTTTSTTKMPTTTTSTTKMPTTTTTTTTLWPRRRAHIRGSRKRPHRQRHPLRHNLHRLQRKIEKSRKRFMKRIRKLQRHFEKEKQTHHLQELSEIEAHGQETMTKLMDIINQMVKQYPRRTKTESQMKYADKLSQHVYDMIDINLNGRVEVGDIKQFLMLHGVFDQTYGSRTSKHLKPR